MAACMRVLIERRLPPIKRRVQHRISALPGYHEHTEMAPLPRLLQTNRQQDDVVLSAWSRRTW
jgi:hypothetical protein